MGKFSLVLFNDPVTKLGSGLSPALASCAFQLLPVPHLHLQGNAMNPSITGPYHLKIQVKNKEKSSEIKFTSKNNYLSLCYQHLILLSEKDSTCLLIILVFHYFLKIIVRRSIYCMATGGIQLEFRLSCMSAKGSRRGFSRVKASPLQIKRHKQRLGKVSFHQPHEQYCHAL